MRALGFLFVLLTAASAECEQNRSIDFGVMQPYEAHVVAASGQVSRIRDAQVWAVSSGERVRVQQLITTGPDGYAKFVVAGGSSFEVFADSRLVFRQNTATVGDLLDVIGGRVRVHFQPALGQTQQRVFTPTAIVTAHQPATIAVAIDEDDTVRIDVLEGEVAVQHALLPNGPTMVKAIDAILVRPDEAISRRVDRGSLYRYTMKPLHGLWSSVARISGKETREATDSQKLLAVNSIRRLTQRF